MNANVSSILLGVRDLERSKRFYTEDPDGYIWNLGYRAEGRDQPYAE
jgi:catechol 2,3-dioxygenase-like lactoylglutathione lyase family enzyme